jgi:hypothetical protein
MLNRCTASNHNDPLGSRACSITRCTDSFLTSPVTDLKGAHMRIHNRLLCKGSVFLTTIGIVSLLTGKESKLTISPFVKSTYGSIDKINGLWDIQLVTENVTECDTYNFLKASAQDSGLFLYYFQVLSSEFYRRRVRVVCRNRKTSIKNQDSSVDTL